MRQGYLRFPKFFKFIESSASFRKKFIEERSSSNECLVIGNKLRNRKLIMSESFNLLKSFFSLMFNYTYCKRKQRKKNTGSKIYMLNRTKVLRQQFYYLKAHVMK